MKPQNHSPSPPQRTPWVLNTLFILCIVLPGLGHLGGFFDLSYIHHTEKRPPYEMPPFPDHFRFTKSYTTSLDNYFKDHFGFRSQLIRVNNLMRYKLGLSGSPYVLLGKDSWMFFTQENMIDQYRGIIQFTDDEVWQWTKAMEARQEWLGKRSIPFLLVILPNKCTIYSEFLPDWVTKVSKDTQFTRLSSYIQTHSKLDFIDMTEALRRSKTIDPVYNKTDSHWNLHGGFVGYQMIMQRVKRYFPDIKIVSEEEAALHFKKSHGKDLAAMLNISNDISEPYHDKSAFDYGTNVRSKTPLDTIGHKFIVETNNTGMPKALIFRDSFTDMMIPFFNQSFSAILYAQHEHDRFNTQLVESFKPDIVIHIIVERLIQYMPYNIDSSLFLITNWGPKTTRAGESFNTIQNGQAALWMIANKVTSNTVIIWEGIPLPTVSVPEKSTASAIIPKKLYTKKGAYTLYLLDQETQQKSNKVQFKVTD